MILPHWIKIRWLPTGQSGGGFTLIQMVVVMAIVVVMAGVLMSGIRNSLSAIATIQEKGDKEELRRLIRLGRDCVKTKAVACVADRRVAFKRADGKDLVAIDAKPNVPGPQPQLLGKLYVRARCKSDRHEYKVEVQRVDKPSSPWTELFDKIPDGC